MNQEAANLVDGVLPAVRYRQWVLTFPLPLRLRLAWDVPLRRAVHDVFRKRLFRWYALRLEDAGHRGARCGAVTFLQNFGSYLNLNLHFHVLCADGGWCRETEGDDVVFTPAAPPSTEEVQALVEDLRRRIDRLLARRGLLDEPEDEDDDGQKLMMEASVAGRVALGLRAGKKPRVLRGVARGGDFELPKQCGQAGWYNLHAGVIIGAHDRVGRERIVRYLTRPPLSRERLRALPDGRYEVRFKRPWRDGTRALLLDGVTLVERLAALVHPRGAHRVLYSGVLASAARWRALIVPKRPDQERHPLHPPHQHGPAHRWARWIPWQDLLWRVFSVPRPRCDDCAARMQVHAVVMGFWATRRVLACLKLPMDALPLAPSRAPPMFSVA